MIRRVTGCVDRDSLTQASTTFGDPVRICAEQRIDRSAATVPDPLNRSSHLISCFIGAAFRTERHSHRPWNKDESMLAKSWTKR